MSSQEAWPEPGEWIAMKRMWLSWLLSLCMLKHTWPKCLLFLSNKVSLDNGLTSILCYKLGKKSSFFTVQDWNLQKKRKKHIIGLKSIVLPPLLADIQKGLWDLLRDTDIIITHSIQNSHVPFKIKAKCWLMNDGEGIQALCCFPVYRQVSTKIGFKNDSVSQGCILKLVPQGCILKLANSFSPSKATAISGPSQDHCESGQSDFRALQFP